MDKEDLQGRFALVTGGSGDIGAAIGRALARRGADLAIHYFRNREKAAEIQQEIEALGRRCFLIPGDLTRRDAVERIAEQVLAVQPVDILVNNAGTPIRRVHWMDLEDAFIDQVFALNFRAPLYLAQKLAPGMVRQRHGVIINILSVAAHTCGTETVFAYGAAKGALLALTRGLARTLAPQGVRVLAVSPGTIDTRIQRTLTSPELLDQLVSDIPLRRIGQPQEVGEVVAFLATDQASFMVGETVEVNGGVYMA